MIKVGDRVRVYATLFGAKAESPGKVMLIRDDGMLWVRLDGQKVIVAHPRQCRKLKPKQKDKKFFWVSLEDLTKAVEAYSGYSEDAAAAIAKKLVELSNMQEEINATQKRLQQGDDK